MYTVREDYRLKKIAKLIRDEKKIADIGYADSPNPFLKNETIIGIDLQEKSCPPNYSSTFTGTIEEYANNQPDLFDGISAGEIIEHLEEPISFLRSCHKLLKNNGTLVLSTPNPNSPIERILTLNLSRRFFYTSDHIFLFPQRWLIRILEISGFKEIKLYSGGFPAPVIGTVPFPRPWCHQTIAVAKKC